MDFSQAIQSYVDNFLTAVGFALLLIFVLPFSWLSSSFVSSGNVLIGYGFLSVSLVESLLLLALVLAFLFFYSFVVCLLVLAVRRDLTHVKTSRYIDDKIPYLAFRYFRFLAIFTVVGALISSLLIYFGAPVLLSNFLLLVFSSAFIFLPQVIVIDEEGLTSSVLSNFDFIKNNPVSFVFVIVFGSAALFVLQLLEFVVDSVAVAGNFLSLLLALVLLVPFIEILKTQIYMSRFSIVDSYESMALMKKRLKGNH